MRVTAGLFRLWVVLSVLWLAAAGAYTVVSYQNVSLPDLKNGLMFDDLIPAYEACWDYRTSDGKRVDRSRFSDEALAQVAECERGEDRWLIIKSGYCLPSVFRSSYSRLVGLSFGRSGVSSRHKKRNAADRVCGGTVEIADDWPEYAVGPKDSLFAIGVASSNFVRLETILHFIFATVLDLTQENSEMITSKLGAEAVVNLTRQTLDKLSWTPDTKDRVLHFLKGFEICLANRNHLMHSEISWLMGTYETEKTFLFKTTKKGEFHMAAPKLPELRRVADSMMIFTHYGRRFGLSSVIIYHRAGR